MNLHKQIFTKNACYIAGRKINPTGIMVHSTGSNNPRISRYVGPDDGLLGPNLHNNHWNQQMDSSVCVHAFIGLLGDGKTVATYQTLPWDHRAWHCGSGQKGSANNTHISFEICEGGLSDRDYFSAVYKEAAELCAMLCNMFAIDPLAKSGVRGIICHSEGRALGVASNHADVMHWFPRHGKTMDAFRTDVRNMLDKGCFDMTADDIRKIVREEFEKLNPSYKDIKGVPEHWKKETQRLLDAGAIDGGTPADINATDVNLRHETLKAAVIATRYSDA